MTAKDEPAKEPARKPRRPAKKSVLPAGLKKKRQPVEKAHAGEKETLEKDHQLVKPVQPKVDNVYIFATGRRKTAVANVRLFRGTGENLANKKPVKDYFNQSQYLQEIEKPFNLVGQSANFYFTCGLSGGGSHAQAKALQHGLATALAKASPEHRKILKKNGLLTRDDRKKERKKPGLKRARRAPQWAKR